MLAKITLALVMTAAAGSASACRVPGMVILREGSPASSETPKNTVALRVRVEGFAPGNTIETVKPTPGRGYFAGVATITAAGSGFLKGSTVPLYLPQYSDCSYFALDRPRKVNASGIVFGTVLRDANGRFLSVAETFTAKAAPRGTIPF